MIGPAGRIWNAPEARSPRDVRRGADLVEHHRLIRANRLAADPDEAPSRFAFAATSATVRTNSLSASQPGCPPDALSRR
jgi:hypothetical protein